MGQATHKLSSKLGTIVPTWRISLHISIHLKRPSSAIPPHGVSVGFAKCEWELTSPSATLDANELTPTPTLFHVSSCFWRRPLRTSSLQAPIMLLTGHAGEVFAAEFSPDGQSIASASFDRQVGECFRV